MYLAKPAVASYPLTKKHSLTLIGRPYKGPLYRKRKRKIIYLGIILDSVLAVFFTSDMSIVEKYKYNSTYSEVRPKK